MKATQIIVILILVGAVLFAGIGGVRHLRIKSLKDDFNEQMKELDVLDELCADPESIGNCFVDKLVCELGYTTAVKIINTETFEELDPKYQEAVVFNLLRCVSTCEMPDGSPPFNPGDGDLPGDESPPFNPGDEFPGDESPPFNPGDEDVPVIQPFPEDGSGAVLRRNKRRNKNLSILKAAGLVR